MVICGTVEANAGLCAAVFTVSLTSGNRLTFKNVGFFFLLSLSHGLCMLTTCMSTPHTTYFNKALLAETKQGSAAQRQHREVLAKSGTAGLFDVIALRPLNLIGGPGGTDSAEHCAL